MSVREALFVALQHVIPQHGLSRLVYHLTRSRTAVIKNALISSFTRGFQPDMTEAIQRDPLGYASFNDFFTRALRPDARPADPSAGALVSPVDGTISQIGKLDGTQILQAKGHRYSLEALLGCDEVQWAQRFAGGSFATLYLAPSNYHRIHMPLAGTLRAAWYVPGKLFSVNAATTAAVPGLFARNERVVCIFEDGSRLFAVILVGALFVGSMTTVWHGDITPRSPRKRLELPLETRRAPLRLEKGAEMGRFNMGSTVILLFPAGMSDWLPELLPLDRIRMGQTLARLTAAGTPEPK